MEEILLNFSCDCGALMGRMHTEVNVYKDRIEISRDTKRKVAKNTTIYFESVTSIIYREGKYGFSERWISFTVPGIKQNVVTAVKPGSIIIDPEVAPYEDENSIVFKKDSTDAEAIYKRIQELYREYQNSRNTESLMNIVQESVMDKLKKLKELYDLEIVTSEEYEEKRSKLLQEI